MKVVEYEKPDESVDLSEELFTTLSRNEIEIKRADRIISICSNFSFQPLNELTCLDLGLSSGAAVLHYAEHFKKFSVSPIRPARILKIKLIVPNCPDSYFPEFILYYQPGSGC